MFDLAIRTSAHVLVGATCVGMAVASASQRTLAADMSGAGLPPPIGAMSGAFVHVGPSGILPDEGARIRAGGVRVPGGNIAIDDQAALAVEVGYHLDPNVAIAFTAGAPILTKINAAGSLQGLGSVGKVLNGPVGLEIQYHLKSFGAVQPYVGVGPAFLLILDNEDGVLSRFRVRDNVGVSFQAGVDVMIDQHWGLFFDVKKALLRTSATGYLGPARIDAHIALDPVIVHSGVTYRF